MARRSVGMRIRQRWSVAASPELDVRHSSRARVTESFHSVLAGRTPMEPRDAAAYIAEAWRLELGEQPSSGAVSILWAQWALETGRGRSMYGHNFGGLKGRAPDGRSLVLWTTEGGLQTRRLRSRFRAYACALDGARDWLRTLATRFPDAIHAVRTGNPDSYVAALESGGYFTASPTAYRTAVAALTREFRTRGPDSSQMSSPTALQPGVDGVLWVLRRAVEKHLR